MANRILPLLGVLLASTACARSETVERASAAGEGHTLAAAPAQYRLRGWQPRQEYDYRVHTSSLITLAGKSPLYDFDLKANARVLALDVAGDRGSFYLSLEDVEFTSRIPGTQADFDALKGQLAQPYFFELKGGLVSSAQVPQDLHP